MSRFKIIIAIIFSVIFTSCCSCRISGSKQVSTLLNSKWQVDELRGKAVDKVMAESFTMVFDSKRGAVYGMGSCNKYFSSYSLEGKNIVKFSSIGSTKMLCEDFGTETKFFDVLKSVDGFIIDGDELMLLNRGNVVAVLSKIKDMLE